MSAGGIGRDRTLPNEFEWVSVEWGGVPFPAPSMKYPMPHGAKRRALASEPGESLEYKVKGGSK